MRSPFVILDYGKVIVQVQVAPMTEANMRVHLDEQSARMRERLQQEGWGPPSERGALLIDGSCDLVPPATVRRMQAEWLNEHRDFLLTAVGSVAFVVPHPLSRGAMRAALWLAPMEMDLGVHDTLESALDWSIARLDSWGGEAPQHILMGGAMVIERDKLALAA